MEPRRFDDLSRSMTPGVSRRRLWAWIGAGGLAALGAWFRRDRLSELLSIDLPGDPPERPTKTVIPSPRMTPTVPSIIPTTKPTVGQPGSDTTECPTGTTPCGVACVDLLTDLHNCGDCGNACSSANGEQCVDATCTTPCQLRTDGLTSLCGGVCVDLISDQKHCGACGTDCGDGMDVCSDGKCTMVKCGDGEQYLCPPDRQCVDLGINGLHCGACGNVCASGEECVAGVCRTDLVTPDTDECEGVDLQYDEANCGACGNVCGKAFECLKGQCLLICPGADCGGVCVDTRSDSTNCGSCGTACPQGEYCSNGSCSSVSDQRTCPAQYPPSFTHCGGGVCVDLATDPANCGSCGHGCPLGYYCSNGSCSV
jgi:hypothetical protein